MLLCVLGKRKTGSSQIPFQYHCYNFILSLISNEPELVVEHCYYSALLLFGRANKEKINMIRIDEKKYSQWGPRH